MNMAKTNNKLSKTINPSRARHLTIDAGLIRAFLLDAIEARGVQKINNLLIRGQINPASLTARGARIPYENVSKVFNRIMIEMSDEDMGRLERPVPPGYFRLMMRAAIKADSLLQALETVIEYRNVATSAVHHSITLTGNQVVFSLEHQPGEKILTPGAIDFYLSGIVRILSWLGNKVLVPTVVRMSSPAPPYSHEHNYVYYGASVLYSQPINCISLKVDALSAKVVQTEESLQKYLFQAPRDLFFPRYMSGTVTESVREVLRLHLIEQHRVLTFSEIANRLGYGTQTLRRRVLEEGTSYHNIKLQERRDRAIHLLRNEQLSVDRVAESVGYTESSNFVRAFRNWTGMTPRQFRKSAF